MQIIRTECMVVIIGITLLFLSGTKERKDESGRLKKKQTKNNVFWKSNGKIQEVRVNNSLKCIIKRK